MRACDGECVYGSDGREEAWNEMGDSRSGDEKHDHGRAHEYDGRAEIFFEPEKTRAAAKKRGSYPPIVNSASGWHSRAMLILRRSSGTGAGVLSRTRWTGR